MKRTEFFKITAAAAIIIGIVLSCIIHGNVAASVSADGTGETTEVLMLMYHSILKDPARTGKYVVTPQELESDLIWLRDNGYTTIFAQDLISWVYDSKALPSGKLAILTFDDGYYNNYLYAFPLLKKYDCKAVISVIGTFTEQYTESGEKNAYYSHVTWDMITEMVQSGYVEIANHSYNMHTIDKGRRGSSKKKNESLEAYRGILEKDLMGMQDKMLEKVGFAPSTYTYPFGSVCKDSIKIIKELGFKASISCSEGINKLSGDPDELYLLKRYLRPGGVSTEKFFSDVAEKQKK